MRRDLLTPLMSIIISKSVFNKGEYIFNNIWSNLQPTYYKFFIILKFLKNLKKIDKSTHKSPEFNMTLNRAMSLVILVDKPNP